MMKHRFRVLVPLFSVGAVVILLALILALNLDHVVTALGSSFFLSNPGNSRMLIYIIAALVPVISGVIMGVAIIILLRQEDREYDQLWQEAQDAASPVYHELTQCFDSIDASIAKLQDASEKIKCQTEELEALSRRLVEKPNPAAVKVEKPAIYIVTMGNNKVSNLKVIHHAGKLVPQGPVPLPQSHQMIWFFPHK
jgi:hypothetical protein